MTVWIYVDTSKHETNPDRNGPLSDSLNLMEYTRKDIILLVVTTMAVAVRRVRAGGLT
jgi:hypothetical protein